MHIYLSVYTLSTVSLKLVTHKNLPHVVIVHRRDFFRVLQYAYIFIYQMDSIRSQLRFYFVFGGKFCYLYGPWHGKNIIRFVIFQERMRSHLVAVDSWSKPLSSSLLHMFEQGCLWRDYTNAQSCLSLQALFAYTISIMVAWAGSFI